MVSNSNSNAAPNKQVNTSSTNGSMVIPSLNFNSNNSGGSGGGVHTTVTVTQPSQPDSGASSSRPSQQLQKSKQADNP